MIRFRRLMLDLARDQSGATIIEFAIVVPVLAMMLMAIFDLGFQVYAQSVLQGAVQDAARAATLESGNTSSAALDSKVKEHVQSVIPNAALTFTRKNYARFEDVGAPEDFTDAPIGADPPDGICNNGEAFEDLNGNGNWDTDRGANGVGGARDAVVYSATATFDRVFPFHGFTGLSPQITIEGATVLRNQPFDEQGTRAPVVGYCT